MKKPIVALAIALLLSPALPALAADTTRPEVGAPAPDHANVGVPSQVTATVSDVGSGLASCNLYVNNLDAGAMTISGNQASKSYTFFEAGIHTMFVFCRDHENNFQSGPNTSVTVTPPPGSSDGTPPSVGQVSPALGEIGTTVILSVSVTDSGSGVASCQLLVDGFAQGPMEILFGVASREHVFLEPGSYEVKAQCFDSAGNGATGTPATFIATLPETPAPEPTRLNPTPRLVKLACFTAAPPDDPCRAVYYHGADDKRHAFPNEKVFYSWFQDFTDVQTISAQELAAIALGKQVTYRPGYTLVKFASINKVYAVARGGVLRWVTSEAAANALYGNGWNKIVHDISDTFFLDYTFGADILVPQDFSPNNELTNTPTIDDNLGF